MEDTHGEPHKVSAIMAGERERAKPKSAIFNMGTPRGCPFAMSCSEAGFKSRFYNVSEHNLRGQHYVTYLGLDISVNEVLPTQELQSTG